MSLESTFVIGSIDGGTKSSSISLSIWPFFLIRQRRESCQRLFGLLAAARRKTLAKKKSTRNNFNGAIIFVPLF